MDINEVKFIIKKNNVPGQRYSLNGGLREDTICFSEMIIGKLWEVYYTEKGEKFNIKRFYNEDEACKYFIYMLKEDRLIT